MKGKPSPAKAETREEIEEGRWRELFSNEVRSRSVKRIMDALTGYAIWLQDDLDDRRSARRVFSVVRRRVRPYHTKLTIHWWWWASKYRGRRSASQVHFCPDPRSDLPPHLFKFLRNTQYRGYAYVHLDTCVNAWRTLFEAFVAGRKAGWR